jgi:hypothetical protein
MWGTFEDYMIAIIGMMIALWQLVEEIRKKGSRTKMTFLSIGVIALGIMLMSQINRTNREKEKTDKRFESITNQLTAIQEAKSRDSTNSINEVVSDSIKDAEFQEKLFKEFKITRDSFSNRPVLTITNTRIQKVDNLRIGPK